MKRWIVPGTLFALMYLLVLFRGVVGSDTPVSQMPLDLGNKAVALAAVGTLAVALITGPLLRRKRHIGPDHPLHPRPLGWAVLTLSIAHAIASMLMMDLAYMGDFYHEPEAGVAFSMVVIGLLGNLISRIIAKRPDGAASAPAGPSVGT